MSRLSHGGCVFGWKNSRIQQSLVELLPWVWHCAYMQSTLRIVYALTSFFPVPLRKNREVCLGKESISYLLFLGIPDGLRRQWIQSSLLPTWELGSFPLKCHSTWTFHGLYLGLTLTWAEQPSWGSTSHHSFLLSSRVSLPFWGSRISRRAPHTILPVFSWPKPGATVAFGTVMSWLYKFTLRNPYLRIPTHCLPVPDSGEVIWTESQQPYLSLDPSGALRPRVGHISYSLLLRVPIYKTGMKIPALLTSQIEN